LRSKLKLLGVSSTARAANVPDVPTFSEEGVHLVRELWQGIFAPPNTPTNITMALSRAIRDVVATPEYQSKVREYGSTPSNMTQSEFTTHFLEDHRSWGELVRSANVKLE
jgi:tripartite-type tricarboxylate transporter receptor subunit TctC